MAQRSWSMNRARRFTYHAARRRARNSDQVRGEELESAMAVRSLGLLGRILPMACLKRMESRGAHSRLDCPEQWPALARNPVFN